MAMNKKERAYVEQLEEQLRLAKALRFTESVEPDVAPPTDNTKLSKGFLFNDSFNYYRVEPACSSIIYHGFGRNDRTTTQGARHLYSTRSLALRAMRHCAEQRCALMLADIDRQIEQAEAEEKASSADQPNRG